MSDSELNVGDFDPETYQHVLPEGAHDFDDYDSEYEREHQELGFTDAQVEEVKKLNAEDRKWYEEYKEFLDIYYRQHGRIIELPDIIKLIMTGRFPEIPSTTQKEQEDLREKLMVKTRKREMSQRAGLEEEPPRKIRRVVPEMVGNIIDITHEEDPDAPILVKITPGLNPYLQLDREEAELEYKVGDESASETHPDDTSADDLSWITLDSLKYIDNDKVKNIWQGMAKIKKQQCAKDLLTELGSEEKFRRILAVGYMSYQAFEKNRKKRLGEDFKPNTVREVAARFNISTSRLMDLRRGAAINREDTQRAKMLKAEKKEEEEGKTPVGSREATPDTAAQLSTSAE